MTAGVVCWPRCRLRSAPTRPPGLVSRWPEEDAISLRNWRGKQKVTKIRLCDHGFISCRWQSGNWKQASPTSQPCFTCGYFINSSWWKRHRLSELSSGPNFLLVTKVSETLKQAVPTTASDLQTMLYSYLLNVFTLLLWVSVSLTSESTKDTTSWFISRIQWDNSQ